MTLQSNPVISRGLVPFHGSVFSPASRAYYAQKGGFIPGNKANGLEGGKFFPATRGGLSDPYAPEDASNKAPPPDGQIASGGQTDCAYLDKPGSQWTKHDVRSNEILPVSWSFTANHVTRRWNYFITREEWDPSQPLSRASFEENPIYTAENKLKPYWQYASALKPATPTVHDVPLPEREGYHVLLAVWEVADTANAFYQVIDLDFVPGQGGVKPPAPTGLTYRNLTSGSVELNWKPVSSPAGIKFYRIKRDGIAEFDVDASQTSFVDESLLPATGYTYTVSAVGVNDVVSSPSNAIDFTTPAEGGDDAPPTAPASLHAMSITADSVTLMWGASSGTPVGEYIIYRQGIEVGRSSGNSYLDRSLTPETFYRYFVAARGINGHLSMPSNVLSVTTEAQDNGNDDGENGDYPAWTLGSSYTAGDIVNNVGKQWQCIANHVAYTPDWAPGAQDGFTLWREYRA